MSDQNLAQQRAVLREEDFLRGDSKDSSEGPNHGESGVVSLRLHNRTSLLGHARARLVQESAISDGSTIPTNSNFEQDFQNLQSSDPQIVLNSLQNIRAQITKNYSDAFVQTLVMAGVIDITVTFLQYTHYPDIQFCSALILCNACSSKPDALSARNPQFIDVTARAVEKNAIPNLISLLSSKDLNLVSQAAWTLANICGDSAPYTNLAIDADVFGYLEPFLKQEPTSDHHSKIVWLLSQLCAVKLVPKVSKQTLHDLVAYLLRSLEHAKSGTNELQDSLIALQGVSEYEHTLISKIVSHPYCVKIRNILSYPNQSEIYHSLRLIANCSMAHASELSTIFDLKLLKDYSILLEQRVPQFSNEILYALSNFASDSHTHVQFILDSGIINTIFTVIKTLPASSAIHLSSLFKNLLVRPPDQVQAVFDYPVIQLFDSFLQTESEKIRLAGIDGWMTNPEIVCDVISSVYQPAFHSSEEDQTKSEGYQRLLSQLVISELSKLSQTHVTPSQLQSIADTSSSLTSLTSRHIPPSHPLLSASISNVPHTKKPCPSVPALQLIQNKPFCTTNIPFHTKTESSKTTPPNQAQTAILRNSRYHLALAQQSLQNSFNRALGPVFTPPRRQSLSRANVRGRSIIQDDHEMELIRSSVAQKENVLIRTKEQIECASFVQLAFPEIRAKRAERFQQSKQHSKLLVALRRYFKRQEDAKKQEALKAEKARMKALKENNMERYMVMVKQAKNERLQQILAKTESFLEQICVRVDAVTDGDIKKEVAKVESQKGEKGEDASLLSNQNLYYAVAHKITEPITEQPKMLVGGKLKGYQMKGLEWMVSLYNNNLNGILADEMGLGKAQPLTSLVLTPNGWRTMGSLKVGDDVIAVDGKSAKITGVFPQGEKEIFQVGFSDGSIVESTDEHLWEVQIKQHGVETVTKVMELKQISEILNQPDNTKQFTVRTCSPVHFNSNQNNNNHLNQARQLGASIVTQTFKPSPSLVDHSTEIGTEGSSSWAEYNWLVFGSLEVRSSFFEGLTESLSEDEKSTLKTSKAQSFQIELDTSIAPLVEWVVRSLGGIVSQQHTSVRTILTISISSSKSNTSSTDSLSHQITSITHHSPAPAQCIMIDHPSHLYLTNSFIPTHNTIQCIALISYLIEKKKNNGPYLIVVPLTTITNWSSEFARWAPSISVVEYRGTIPERNEIIRTRIRTQKYTVLITTYEYAMNDKSILGRPEWQYIIIDEGHRLKNSKGKFVGVLMKYRSKHRLLMTGTPLQNNLTELWSLLNFLLPSIFNSSETFEKWFATPLATNGVEKVDITEEEKLLVINRLHTVLRPFLLRRLVSEVATELPRKVEHLIKCDLSIVQRRLYARTQEEKAVIFEKSSNAVRQTPLNNTAMQLRKVCNHPFLFLGEYFIDDSIWKCSGKFDVLDRILPKLQRTGHRVLIFCQHTHIMSIMEAFFKYRHYSYLRLDGSTKNRGEMIDEFNKKETFIFLLSTRAGGQGLNLQVADTVILFDSDWNPFMDLQAQARAYRIGQTTEVRVIRLVTISPIEQRILDTAQVKLDVDHQVIQAGKFNTTASKEERTRALFDLINQKPIDEEEYEEVVKSKDRTYTRKMKKATYHSDEEINTIIARSDEEFELFEKMDEERYAAYWAAQNSQSVPAPSLGPSIQSSPTNQQRKVKIIFSSIRNETQGASPDRVDSPADQEQDPSPHPTTPSTALTGFRSPPISSSPEMLLDSRDTPPTPTSSSPTPTPFTLVSPDQTPFASPTPSTRPMEAPRLYHTVEEVPKWLSPLLKKGSYDLGLRRVAAYKEKIRKNPKAKIEPERIEDYDSQPDIGSGEDYVKFGRRLRQRSQISYHDNFTLAEMEEFETIENSGEMDPLDKIEREFEQLVRDHEEWCNQQERTITETVDQLTVSISHAKKSIDEFQAEIRESQHILDRNADQQMAWNVTENAIQIEIQTEQEKLNALREESRTIRSKLQTLRDEHQKKLQHPSEQQEENDFQLQINDYIEILGLKFSNVTQQGKQVLGITFTKFNPAKPDASFEMTIKTGKPYELTKSRGHQIKLRLFCFAHAGATPSLFNTRWAKFLPPQVEVVGIHSPGRTSRLHETPFKSIPSLITQLIKDITPIFTTEDYLPYVVYGNSMGAICAYEFTRRVRNAGFNEALALIVSSCLPPQICGADDPVCDLPDDELQKVLEFRFGYPIISDPEIIKITFPSLRADLAAIDHYSSTPYSTHDPSLKCPIHAIVGAKDKMVSLDTQVDWNIHTSSSLHTNRLPGIGHFVYDSPAFQNIVRRVISDCIDDVDERIELTQFKVVPSVEEIQTQLTEIKEVSQDPPTQNESPCCTSLKPKKKKKTPVHFDLETSFDFC
ncbi:putative Chromatin structure-remodeling complex subunit snf21 [Blattamonas nauphoetae]|uniref:Chromatin structure-remodeling complex subunit snf21 n=1 Tax=Blattamonas nauphoetae TaxID=2049346 RepID=A0ABQ9XBN8_9EUKA|nr:putative Chromatin structure-remodeling complex subunit snf21 [Blattamonas nauphoetae]